MADEEKSVQQFMGWMLGVLLALVILGVGVLIALVASPALATGVKTSLSSLFALNTAQTMWYVTRAAGLMAYLLLWLSTVWGLCVSSKFADPWLNRLFSYEFHQFLSLLSIGFIALHIVVLMADKYLPYSLAQVLVPFISPYRPLWVGVGVIGFYLILLVSATFYVRARIGNRAFRTVHYLSYLAFFSSAAHGLFSGTDSPLLMTQIMYAGTSLLVVFLTVYRILTALPVGRHETGRTTQIIRSK